MLTDASSNPRKTETGQTAPFGLCVLAVLALYAAGLSRDLTEPWVGMHDWNGAFYSQLARNMLRYPWSEHHGMPIVAVGETLPPVDERSFYATHPPGLVWLVAGAFAIGGEAESVARMVPIVASLASLLLLVHLVAAGRDRETAVVVGLIYAAMPMTVYFGRMVDQEAVCLFFMLGSLASWRALSSAPTRRPIGMWAAWSACMVGVVFTDWAGVLFGSVFCVHVMLQRRAEVVGGRAVAAVCAVVAGSSALMLTHLVLAGLDGNWSDLWAIFVSRAGGEAVGTALERGGVGGDWWGHVVANLTWPVLAIAGAGGVLLAVRAMRPGRARSAAGDPPGAAGVGLWTLAATGTIWLLLFPQQFQRHHYWMFYLGPAVATGAGVAITECRQFVGANRRGIVRVSVLAGVLGVLWVCFLGSSGFFARNWYPTDSVRAWQAIRQTRTTSGERVLLFRDPFRVEERGDYVFRNIVPPQLAFYLDRPIEAATDLTGVVPRSVGHAVFAIPFTDSIEHGRDLAELRRVFPEDMVGDQVVFDLRTPRPVPDEAAQVP